MKITTYLLILGSLLLSCTETSEPCYEYQLAYISKASGNFDIYANDLKGNETQLTTNPSWDWSPMWNASSNSLIYYSYVNDTFKIQRMAVDGKQLPLNTYGLTEYNLSPNGELLVSQESVDDFSKLVLSDVKGEGKEDITNADSYNGRAIWSPDSKRIVYISDRDGNNEVYLYELATKTTTRLTTNATNEKYLSWAPDSKRIAYSTEYYEEGQPDRNDLFVMDLETKAVTQITNNAYEDSEIAWSPEGSRIAFHSKRDSIDHIFTINIDGTDVRQVTTDNVYHGEPEWIVIESRCNQLEYPN